MQTISDEIVDAIILYEEDKLNNEEIEDLFQELIDRNLISKLGISYETMARTLAMMGKCEFPYQLAA